MKSKYFLIMTYLLLFAVTNCDTNDPPAEGSLTLKLEDVSCTEAWITLTTANFELPSTVTIKQNNQTRITINLIKADTLLYVDSLLPNKNYTFQASTIENRAISNELNVTTMDTTNHNFTWQTWSFGEHSSSVLYDVAIIDENNIWAVGKIYMNDSSGQPDPQSYNTVHWDGNDWKLHRVMFYAGCSNPTSMVPYPASSIIVFNGNDIWIAMEGDQVARLNGLIQTETHCMPISFTIKKIWGSSSENLFVVGDNGTIVRYNGILWGRMGTVTDADIQDIFGITDTNNNVEFILCAASNIAEPGDHKILRINSSNRIDTLSWFYNRRVNSVWMDTRFQLFACGDGMFTSSESGIWIPQDLTPVYKTRIRGNSKNDLFVVGGFGLLAHYNGKSWKEYPEASSALVYTSLDFKNNLMVTVGYTQNQAVIQVMKKE